MDSLNPIIDIMNDSLWEIGKMIIAVYILVTILAMGWKLLEKKLLSMVDKKVYKIKKKKEEIKNSPKGLTLEEQELANQIHIDRSRPSFEEWKVEQQKKKENEN